MKHNAQERSILRRRQVTGSSRIARTMMVLLLIVVLGGSFALAGKYATKEKSQERGQADAEHALVYFARTSVAGSAIYSWIFADEEFVGVLRGRAYTHHLLPAGDHLLWSKAENVSALPVTLEAGQTYYVRVKILPGFGKARVRLEVLAEHEGLEALEKIKKLSTVTEEGREKGQKMAAKYIDLAREKAAK